MAIDLVAGHQTVDDARQYPCRCPTPRSAWPTRASMMFRCRVEDAADVRQHVGHAHQVVVVVARAAQRLHRHQAKQVLQAQRHAHEGVVLHLLH